MQNFRFTDQTYTQYNGITPPVDGEYYTILRSYKLRQSTLRKLHQIKAGNSDINIYMNTIIDNAINYYYENVYLTEQEYKN